MNALIIPSSVGIDAAARRRIAERFATRAMRGYANGKLARDPAYPQVAALLRGSPRSLLDIGCGIGLLGAYLRESGLVAPYLGIDLDQRKIDAASKAVAMHYGDLRVKQSDARALAAFAGDVVMLDVLHYLDAGDQEALLDAAAARVAPGGLLLIRNVLRDRSWRFRVTVWEERLLHAVGWQASSQHFPSRAEVEQPLRAAGLQTEAYPLWRGTPFNSWLVLGRRPARAELA